MSSTAVALVRPSPFDILPSPPPRARHLRNSRKLLRLAAAAAASSTPWWEHAEAEVARQLGEEGFVVLDAFAGLAEAQQVRSGALAALEQSATRGGLSGGSAASVLRGDRTLWATNQSEALDALMPHLRRLDALVSLLGARLPDAADLAFRSEPQLSLYPANGTRYVRHVDNTCTGGEGRLCNGRRLSAVYYLNPAWKAGDGGELRISRKREGDLDELPELDVAPELDRLLLFWADARTPHEVLPSAAPRHAVTVWYFSASELRVASSRQDTGTWALHPVVAPNPKVCATVTGGGGADGAV